MGIKSTKQGKNSGVCLLRGCKNPAHARGYCSKHYRFIKEYGEEEGVKKALEFEAKKRKRMKIKASAEANKISTENLNDEKQIIETSTVEAKQEELPINNLNQKTESSEEISEKTKTQTEDVENNELKDNKICKIDGCGKKVLARGYCSAHYQIIHKYGEEEGLKIISEKQQESSNDYQEESKNTMPEQENLILNMDKLDDNSNELDSSSNEEENKKELVVNGIDFYNSKYLRNKGKKCKLDGCEENALVKGYCGKHYSMIRKYGEEEALRRIAESNKNKTENHVCKVDGCNNKAISKGYCNKHYQQMRIKGYILPERTNEEKKCSIEGCTKKHYAKGLCINHYSQKKRASELDSVQKVSNVAKTQSTRTLNDNVGGCKVHGCDKEIFMNGYCKEHFAQHYNSILSYVFKMQLGNLFVSLDDFESIPEGHMVLSKLKDIENNEGVSEKNTIEAV